MSRNMICPACKAADLDLCCYEAMMVVREDLALFTLRCPHCGAAVSDIRPIPQQLCVLPPSRWAPEWAGTDHVVPSTVMEPTSGKMKDSHAQ